MQLSAPRLILLGLVTLSLFASSTTGLEKGEAKSEKRIRVLVDASKDGGLWWFPQGPPSFDPKKPHQGKEMADLMRKKGWEVVELPRGELITSDTLANFDVIVRTPAFSPYRQSEAAAYRDSVSLGARVLLVGSASDRRDLVAEIFGLRFSTRSQMGSIQKWIPHTLTTNLNCCDRLWVTISKWPNNAAFLAWLGRLEQNDQPVLGYLPYGNGYVVFAGQFDMVFGQGYQLELSSVQYLAKSSAEEIQRDALGSPVLAEEPAGPPGPLLVQPPHGAVLPQPKAGEWRFDWEDVPNATQYNLVVWGRFAVTPLVNTKITSSEYILGVTKGSSIADFHLRGWRWRVRAQGENGKWGDWSKTESFDVAPLVH